MWVWTILNDRAFFIPGSYQNHQHVSWNSQSWSSQNSYQWIFCDAQPALSLYLFMAFTSYLQNLTHSFFISHFWAQVWVSSFPSWMFYMLSLLICLNPPNANEIQQPHLLSSCFCWRSIYKEFIRSVLSHTDASGLTCCAYERYVLIQPDMRQKPTGCKQHVNAYGNTKETPWPGGSASPHKVRVVMHIFSSVYWQSIQGVFQEIIHLFDSCLQESTTGQIATTVQPCG